MPLTFLFFRFVLAALIAYRAGRLARGLARGLAFAAAYVLRLFFFAFENYFDMFEIHKHPPNFFLFIT